MLLTLVTMAFHALFAVSLLSLGTALARPWYEDLGVRDLKVLLADQRTGASMAWAAGELPTVLLLLGVGVLWSRSSEREARRADRAADRDGGDAERALLDVHLAGSAGRTAPPRRAKQP